MDFVCVDVHECVMVFGTKSMRAIVLTCACLSGTACELVAGADVRMRMGWCVRARSCGVSSFHPMTGMVAGLFRPGDCG